MKKLPAPLAFGSVMTGLLLTAVLTAYLPWGSIGDALVAMWLTACQPPYL